MAHDDSRTEVERGEYAADVVGKVAPVVAIAGLAVAVAAEVKAEDARPGRQRDSDRVPERGKEARGVDKEEGLTIAAPVEQMEAKAVRFDEEVTRPWRCQ
jgi:hypothetical protein